MYILPPKEVPSGVINNSFMRATAKDPGRNKDDVPLLFVALDI